MTMPSPSTKEDDAATLPDAATTDKTTSKADDATTAKEDESKKQSLTSSSSSIEKDDAVPNEESKKTGAAVETAVEPGIKRDSPDISPSSESKSKSESEHGKAKVAGTSSSSDKDDHKSEEKDKMNGIQEGNHPNNASSSAASSSSCVMKMYDNEIKSHKDDTNDVEMKDKNEKDPNDKLNLSENEKKKNSSSELSAWANMNMAQPSYILPTECDVLLDSSSEGEGETLQKCSIQEIQYHPANVLLHDLISLHVKILPKNHSTTTTTFNAAATSIITLLKQGAVHSTSRQLLNTTTNTTNTTLDMITVPTPPKQGRFLKRITNSSKHDTKSEEQEKEKHFYKNSNGNQPPFSVISHYSWEEVSEEMVIDFVVGLLRQCLLEATNDDDADESTADAKHKEKQQDSAESTNNMIEVQTNDVLLLNSHPKDGDKNEETNKDDTDATLAQQYKDHVGNANYLKALEEKVNEFGSQNTRPCSVSSNQRAALALSIVDGILQANTKEEEKEQQGRFLIRKGNEWKLADKTSAAEITTSLLCTKCIQADRHRRARQKCLEGSNIVTAGSYRPKRKAKEELAKTVLTMTTTTTKQQSSSSSSSQRPTKKQKQSQPNKILNGTTTTNPNNPPPKPTPTTQGIQTPTEHDVLFGRGGLTNSHIGNRRFRDIIALHRPDYVSAPKVEKPNVARRIVRAIRGADPPGRFLKKSAGIDGLWYDVGDKHAAEKTSQALREKSQEERYRKATKRRLEAKTKRLEKEVNRAAAAAASGGGSSLDAAVRYLKDSRNAAVVAAAAAGAVPPPAMHVMQGGGVVTASKGGAPITPLPAGVHLAHPPTMVQGSVHPSLLHNTDASQLKHTQLLPHHPPPPGVAHHHPPPPGYPLHPSAAAAAAGRMGAHPPPPPHGHLAAASYGRGHPIPSAPSSQQPAPGPAPTGTTTKKGAKKATAKDKEAPKTDKAPAPTPPPTTTTTGIITKITKEMIPTTQSPPVPPFSVIGLTDGAGNIIVTENDILCGRGGLTNHHRGNKRFRDIVSLHRPDYILATKVQKPAVSRLIVAAIRNGNPPGRFLKKDDKTGRWFDIGDKRAAEKASQALREKPSEERGGAAAAAAANAGGRVSPGPYSSVVQGQGTVNVAAAAASVASPMNSLASGVPPAQPAAAVVAQQPPPPAPNAVPPSVKKESPAKVQTTTTTTPPPPPTEKTNDDTVATQSVTV